MERKQFERAAAANHYLRGLLAVPFGLLLIVSALGNMDWGPFGHLWVVPAFILLVGGGYLVLTRYYNEHYGRVTLQPRASTVAGMVAAMAVFIGGPLVVQALDLPFNGFGLAWALVALGYYSVTVGLRAHHVAIWGVVLALSLVPFWGDPRTTDSPNIGLLMIGVAAIVTGLLDHRLLVRTFGPSDGLDLERSNAGA
jgi:hypothetical protein